MIETADDGGSTAALRASCRQHFERGQYESCISYAEGILSTWSKAKPDVRNRICRDVWASAGLGCLACVKLRDFDRAMSFYEQALAIKPRYWELAIRLANHLARNNQPAKLESVVNQLNVWALENPKRKQQLTKLLVSIADAGFQRPARQAQILKTKNFLDRPQKEVDSTLWVKALGRTVFGVTSGYTIVINPKSACSTLKFNLWRQEYETGATKWKPPGARGGIHRRENSPIQKVPVSGLEDALFGKQLFSIVRNPYSRVLSAYLDKIAGDKKEKRQLLLSMGFAQNTPVTFAEFVDFISRQNPREMEAHYAPQAYLMQIDYLPYARIGSVEAIDESISGIVSTAYGIHPKDSAGDFRPHRTGASSMLSQYYSPGLAAKIRDRFSVDFDRFGYSTDLAEAHLPPRGLERAAQCGRAKAETVLRPILRAVIAERAKNYAAAFDVLSTVATEDPEIDFAKARLLMHLGRSREALDLLNGVVARVTNVSHYWMLLAECLLDLRRRKEAVDAAEIAASISFSELILRRVLRVLRLAREKQKAQAYKEKLAMVEVLYFGRPSAGRLLLRAKRQGHQSNDAEIVKEAVNAS